jgi:DNA repair exonuclease SbcCD ATPase subunit
VARLLIGANEKVTSMAKGVKSFGRNLPSSKYTGLQAIAFGFGKRVEEVVEEVLRQREAALTAHREVREQMEQRNYSVAIEVSELEASISQLKEDVAKKSSEAEVWKNQATIKDDKFLELEQVFSEKLTAAESENVRLRLSIQEFQSQFQSLKDEAGQHKEILREALKCAGKLRKGLLELPHELNVPSDLDESGSAVSDSANGSMDEKQSMPQKCLAELKALLELGTSIGISWKEKKEDWEKTNQEMVTRIGRLVGQKQDAADLLAAALSEKQQVLETISDLRVKLSQENLEVERLQVSLKEAQELAAPGRESDEEEENEELVRIRAELGLVAQSRDEALSKVCSTCHNPPDHSFFLNVKYLVSEVWKCTFSNIEVRQVVLSCHQINIIEQQVLFCARWKFVTCHVLLWAIVLGADHVTFS